MTASPEHALYRLRRTRRDGVPPKRYRGTWVLSDELTKQVLATCDLMGRAVFGTHEIIAAGGQAWRLQANRAVMPSHWLLVDPARHLSLQFNQQILRQFLIPWRRTRLLLVDSGGNELFRLVDPTTGLDRIFGPSLHDWVLTAGNKPAAKLVRLPTRSEPPKGLLDRVSRLLTQSDQGVASAGPEHVLNAPAALALLMLIHELTDPSAGG